MNLEEVSIQAASEMHDALLDMKNAFAKGEDSRFADASARFGKAMMTNQITFKLAVILAGQGVRAQYVVEGRDVSRYTLELTSTSDTKRTFVRAPKPAPIK